MLSKCLSKSLRHTLGIAVVAGCAGLLAACSNTTYNGVENTTRTGQSMHSPEVGSPDRQTIFGPGGIESLFKGNNAPSQGGGAGIGVNAFLWRAALDTFSFLPPFSADPMGGVLIYDWYTPPQTPDERFKVTVYILDTRLRTDAVKVSVFRQTKAADGSWVEAKVDPKTNTELENAILTRARQLRIAQLGQ